MSYNEILEAVLSLSPDEKTSLISELTSGISEDTTVSLLPQLLNKQGCCPHCGKSHYYRYGKDKGAQRFKCKDCGRTFTEYTGTWVKGLHRKELVKQYISMLVAEHSISYTAYSLKISMGTAFNWRHKILSALSQDDGNKFDGITESDETFIPKSDKGSRKLNRKPRKRGSDRNRRGISSDQAKVLVTADRKNTLNMTCSGYGRLATKDIADSLGTPFTKKVVLCSDANTCYNAFAKACNIEHVVLNPGQHVKKEHFHIQHVNSLHYRLKKWIGWNFCGVATKYLQNYLNWFKTIETVLKKETNRALALLELSLQKKNPAFATLF